VIKDQSTTLDDTSDQERKERIMREMSSAPQHVVVSAFENISDYDPTEAGRGLAVPGFYVAANEPQPRSDMGSFHEMFPQVLDGKTVGSGPLRRALALC